MTELLACNLRPLIMWSIADCTIDGPANASHETQLQTEQEPRCYTFVGVQTLGELITQCDGGPSDANDRRSSGPPQKGSVIAARFSSWAGDKLGIGKIRSARQLLPREDWCRTVGQLWPDSDFYRPKLCVKVAGLSGGPVRARQVGMLGGLKSCRVFKNVSRALRTLSFS